MATGRKMNSRDGLKFGGVGFEGVIVRNVGLVYETCHQVWPMVLDRQLRLGHLFGQYRPGYRREAGRCHLLRLFHRPQDYSSTTTLSDFGRPHCHAAYVHGVVWVGHVDKSALGHRVEWLRWKPVLHRVVYPDAF